MWLNGSYHWVGIDLASLHLSEWLQVTSTCFSTISRTLANLINDYFGGYYAKKMVETQVWLCIDRSSLNQWTNTLPIDMSFRHDGQGFATIIGTSNLLRD